MKKIYNQRVRSPTKGLSFTAKLAVLLFFFLLIFCGTIINIFFHIQKMTSISKHIVSINNTVSAQTKLMIENLLDMDANDKKFRLLKKNIYSEYFDTSRSHFEKSLTKIISLEKDGYVLPLELSEFSKLYHQQMISLQHTLPAPTESRTWTDEVHLNNWLGILRKIKNDNDRQIEQSLMQIHKHSLQITHDGIMGFTFSVLTAFFGVWFISKSILTPLKQLTQGLRTLSRGEYCNKITVSCNNEFRELVTAFNEMSQELHEQENLRSDFIATLSHEIRTPLSSIQESVNMIAEEVLGTINKKQQKFLQIAGTEISRITQLLHHLMHISMLEGTMRDQPLELLDPSELVLYATASLAAKTELNNISFTYDFSPDMLPVQGVREELQQVFLNLIGNAVKFSPREKTVHISAAPVPKTGFLQFMILDQGPGIPAEELSLVFNRYYRSKAVREHTDGVGLGLSISKKIIETLGGSISARNNNGPGCTITLQLPTVTPDQKHISQKMDLTSA